MVTKIIIVAVVVVVVVAAAVIIKKRKGRASLRHRQKSAGLPVGRPFLH